MLTLERHATEGGSSITICDRHTWVLGSNGTENHLRGSLPRKGMLYTQDTVYQSIVQRIGALEKTFSSESNIPST